jgi:alkyl sulfatase BDS1-like metallo-beta-lactamase superfamily hydrolase
VEGPAGLIAIDTGESIEEMRATLVEIRKHPSTPVVAVMYTHFHYVTGTRAITEEPGAPSIPIWGHAGIVSNRTRMASQVSPVAGRGLVHRFGLLLPKDGLDGQVDVGLGLQYRSADHAPFTPGFVAPTHTISAPMDAVNALGRADCGTAQDRALLTQVLHTISQRTTTANLCNWCLTRARELHGLLDLSRLQVHRFSREQVQDGGPATSVHTLRVVLDPLRPGTADSTIHWVFDDGVQSGLHLRHGVAMPTDGRFANGRSADFTPYLCVATLASWHCVRLGLSDVLSSAALQVTGAVAALRTLLSCFEQPTLAK